jgi:hypothetical protein
MSVWLDGVVYARGGYFCRRETTLTLGTSVPSSVWEGWALVGSGGKGRGDKAHVQQVRVGWDSGSDTKGRGFRRGRSGQVDQGKDAVPVYFAMQRLFVASQVVSLGEGIRGGGEEGFSRWEVQVERGPGSKGDEVLDDCGEWGLRDGGRSCVSSVVVVVG